MAANRLNVDEVATEAHISHRSLVRLRALDGEPHRPKSGTLRRVADALGYLTNTDADEIFRELLVASGHDAFQGDLGIRGAAELMSHFQRMSPLGRHLLIQQARLLALELPADEERAGE
jgi:hypothetical protein